MSKHEGFILTIYTSGVGLKGLPAGFIGILDRRNPHHHDTGPQHAQILGNTVRHIDDALAMPAMHAVVDFDDSTAIVIHTMDGDQGTKGEMIAGGRELPRIETLTGRGFATVEALAVKAGLPMQTGSINIENLSRPEFNHRLGDSHRLTRLPGRMIAGNRLPDGRLLARRPAGRRAQA